MKIHPILILLFSVFLLSASHAQTVEEVVNNYLKAIGGKEKLMALKTIRTTGFLKTQGLEIPYIQLQKAPNLQRSVALFQEKSIYQNCFDGTTGWHTNPTTLQLEKLSAEDSELMKADIQMLDPFVNYAERGYSVALEGKMLVEGKECYRVRLMRKPPEMTTRTVAEQSSFYFFDTKSFLPVLVRNGIRKGPGKGGYVDTFLSNFQTVNDLVFPFTISQKINGKASLNIAVTKMELNIDLADQEFAFPGTASK